VRLDGHPWEEASPRSFTILIRDCSIATGADSKIARQEQGESTWDPLNASELAPNSANGLIPSLIAWAKSQPPGNVAIVSIFEEFHAQCAHRIEMEQLRMKTTSTLALRGQMIGGILGAIGLVGSLIVAGIGHGWAGFGIALTSLGSLVSIFVYGRDQQKRERIEKQAIRDVTAKIERVFILIRRS